MKSRIKNCRVYSLLTVMALAVTMVLASSALVYADEAQYDAEYDQAGEPQYNEEYDQAEDVLFDAEYDYTEDVYNEADLYGDYTQEPDIIYEEAYWEEDTGYEYEEHAGYVLLAVDPAAQADVNTDSWIIKSWIYLKDEETEEYTYSASDKALKIPVDELDADFGVEVFLSGMAPGSYSIGIQLTYENSGIWTHFIKSETVSISSSEREYGKTVRISFGEEIPKEYKEAGLYHVSTDVRTADDDLAVSLEKYDYAYENFQDLRESYEIERETAVIVLGGTDGSMPENTQAPQGSDMGPGNVQEAVSGPQAPVSPESSAPEPAAAQDPKDESLPSQPGTTTTGTTAPGTTAPGTDTQAQSGPSSQGPDGTANVNPSATDTAQQQQQGTPNVIGTYYYGVETIVQTKSQGPGSLGEGAITYDVSQGPGGSLGGGGTIISSATGPVLPGPVQTSSSDSGKTASSPQNTVSNTPAATVNTAKTPGSSAFGMASVNPTSANGGINTNLKTNTNTNANADLKVLANTTGSITPLSGADTTAPGKTTTTSPITAPTTSPATAPSGTAAANTPLKVLSQTNSPVTGPGPVVTEAQTTAAAQEPQTRVPGGDPAVTGDDSNIIMFGIIAAAAVSVLAGSVLILRKRKQQ